MNENLFELKLFGGDVTTKLIEDYNFPDYEVICFSIERTIESKSIEELFLELDNYFSEKWLTNLKKPVEIFATFLLQDETVENCRREIKSKVFQISETKKEIYYHVLISELEVGKISEKIKEYINLISDKKEYVVIDQEKIYKIISSIRNNILSLKQLKLEQETCSDYSENSRADILCNDIAEKLKVFAFVKIIPIEVVNVFKEEPWVLDFEFKYWRYNSSSDTRSLLSSILKYMLKDNRKIYSAITNSLN